MTETATRPPEGTTTAQTSAPERHPAPGQVSARITRLQSFGLAIGSLVLVYGLGFVVTLAGGAVMSAIDPVRRIDAFAALHDRWVIGALLGITVLWLFPPHPWAKRLVVPAYDAHRAEEPPGADHAVARDEPQLGACASTSQERTNPPSSTAPAAPQYQQHP